VGNSRKYDALRNSRIISSSQQRISEIYIFQSESFDEKLINIYVVTK